MASWCESINLTSCIWFNDGTERKRVTASIIAGLLFFIGWWLMIDANVVHPELVNIGYYVWGTLGTISLIMVNIVPNSQINGSSLYDGGIITGNTARAWLFVGFVLGFASVIASIWIYFMDFHSKNNSKAPAVEILMQNVLIFVSSIIYKFYRQEEDSTF